MTEPIRTVIPDDGERSVQAERRDRDADDILRLRESELEALQEYDRVLTSTWKGREILVEMLPDDPKYPVEEVDDD